MLVSFLKKPKDEIKPMEFFGGCGVGTWNFNKSYSRKGVGIHTMMLSQYRVYRIGFNHLLRSSRSCPKFQTAPKDPT